MMAVGALIGWFTNFLAIKMLFRPIHPWRIPFTDMELRGLIPGRREEIAASIGKTVVKDLISRLIEGENRMELIRTIRVNILNVIDERIPAIVPAAIKQAILSRIRDILTEEIGSFVDNSMGDLIEDSIKKIDISSLVEERINSLELDHVERLILEISGRELRHIELLGGILGGVIGLAQGLLLLVI
jgi:uncharacterized membrane protein YheB (UPF0754 family)